MVEAVDGTSERREDSSVEHELEDDKVANDLPDWERLLRAAARLQGILPGATRVGSTAAAVVAGHRRSMDADHVIDGLASHFDDVLAQLEAVAGWKTARVKRPVVIMGSLDGILTTVRNQIRSAPLETIEVATSGGKIRVPTKAEILRIKAWLILNRNATRDYLDVVAIADKLGDDAVVAALAPMDRLYPQGGDRGAVRQQLIRQLSMPRPFDLASVKLSEYKGIEPKWRDWSAVVIQSQHIANLAANAVASRRVGWNDIRD